MRTFSPLRFLFPGFVAATAALAAPLTIELPQETGVFAPGQHAELANAHCLSCHSVEYVTSQPRLPRTFWKGSVEKMQQKFGAPIPADLVEPIVQYLVRNYGTGPAEAPPAANAPAPAGAASTASAGSTAAKPAAAPLATDAAGLATRYGCMGCHQPATRLVGPALQEIAAKYRGDGAAAEKIAQQIAQGGAGKWGPIPMPPFPQIPAAEVKTLTAWVLAPPAP